MERLRMLTLYGKQVTKYVSMSTAIVFLSFGNGFAQENCSNGIDDDGDGYVDCYDPECSGNAACDSTFVNQPTPDCQYVPPEASSFNIQELWRTDKSSYPMDNRHTPAIADIDNDGVPEVISYNDATANKLHVFNGNTGALERTINSPAIDLFMGAPAVGDVDDDGFGEIFIVSEDASTNSSSDRRYIFCYEHDGTQKWKSSAQVGNDRWTPNIADFNQDGVPEVYAGNMIFNAVTGVLIADGGSSNSIGANPGSNEEPHPVAADVLDSSASCTDCNGLELICGNEVYSVNISGSSATIRVTAPTGLNDGNVAIVDLDRDGDLDAVVTSQNSSSRGVVYAWDLQTSTQIGTTFQIDNATNDGGSTTTVGGRPNVADFDGDDTLDIGLAGYNVYLVITYSPANNTFTEKWSHNTYDTSERTGSTVFDFEGDGENEVVYKDEDTLFVFKGSDGTILSRRYCGSGTRYDYPLVVDVNGNSQSNIVCICSDGSGPSHAEVGNGYLLAFGALGTPWVKSRKVWNQHSYYTVNINDDLSIPQEQQLHHKGYPVSSPTKFPLNAFLTQATDITTGGVPTYGASNDSIAIGDVFSNIDFSNCQDGTNDSISVAVTVHNVGSEPVPSGGKVSFYNGNPYKSGASLIATQTISQNINPNDSLKLPSFSIDDQGGTFTLFMVTNDNGTGTLPLTAPESDHGECDFTNNVDSVVITGCGIDPPGSVGGGLQLWLAADDIDADGMTNDNPADGTEFNIWYDKSPNRNNAVVFSGQDSATYSSSAGEMINGKPVVRFNRTDQSNGSVYEVDGLDIRAATNEDVTVFTVYRTKVIPTTSLAHMGLWGADDGGWDRFYAPFHDNFGDGVDDGLASLGPTYSGAVVEDAAVVGSVRLLAAVYDGAVSGGTNEGPDNGSVVYFNGNVITRFKDESDDANAKDKFYIGWDGDNGPFDGDIAEILVYNRILTCDQFDQVVAYLGNKYNQTFTTISPGGVACNLRLWLKGDAGTNTTTDGADITAWNDQSGSGNNASNSGLTAPDYDVPSINYNPAIDFSAGNQGLTVANHTDINIASSYTAKSFNLTFRTGSDVSSRQVIYEQGGTTNGINVYVRNNNLYGNLWSSGANNAASTSIQANTTYNYTFIYDAASTDWRGYLNGAELLSDLSAPSSLGSHNGEIGFGQTKNDSRFDDGTTSGEGDYFGGKIAEFDYYNNVLNTEERTKLETYNGLKYGVHIAHDYLSTDSTVLWDSSANATYHHDVTGIGRDDVSTLNQKQSKNESSDAAVAIGIDSIVSSNSGHGSSFSSNNLFLIWGNNNASLDPQTNELPAGSANNVRLGREWKVEEVGGDISTYALHIGGADLSFSANASNIKLLIDTDGDGNFTTGSITTVNADTVINNIARFSSVDLDDNDIFTVSWTQNGPGGIATDLRLWLRADTGTTLSSGDVSNWADQSAASNDLDQSTSSKRPTPVSNGINFNPALDFDGNDILENDATNEGDLSGSNAIEVFGVYDGDSNGDDDVILMIGSASGTDGQIKRFSIEDGGEVATRFNNGNSVRSFSGVREDPHVYHFYNAAGDNYGAHNMTVDGASTSYVSNGSSTNVPNVTDDRIAVGAGRNTSSTDFSFVDGKVAEVIIFDSALTAVQRNKITSYLGLQYGVSLSGSYILSDGDTAWNATTNASYHKDVAGIVRDDLSMLNQKQSKSVNSDAVLTIGLGSIAADNASNSNAFSTDGHCLIWGNNDSSAAYASRVTSGLPMTIGERTNRIWKVEENNGDIGNVEVKIDLTGLGFPYTSASDYELLIDTDTDFSNATIVDANSYSSNVVSFTGVNFADGAYFTLGTSGCGSRAVALAPSGQTTSSTKSCHSGSWTYYYSSTSPNNLLFGIEHKPSGGNTNDFTANVSITTSSDPTDADGVYKSEDHISHEAIYVMGRYWNVDVTSGSLNGAVKVRFLYDSSDMAAMKQACDNFQSLYSGQGVTTSDTVWFKTNDGSSFDPSTDLSANGIIGHIRLNIDCTYTENNIRVTQLGGITSFSGGGAGGSSGSDGGPLPVELLRFDAQVVEYKVVLDWKTTTEINNDHFAMERSADGIVWEEIVTVPGAGNSNQPLYYSHIDYLPLPGISYYRLKQTDFDGQYTYSPIEMVYFVEDRTVMKWKIRTNPVKERLYIDFEDYVDEVTIKITNALSQRTTEVFEVFNIKHFDISKEHFRSGLYYVELIPHGTIRFDRPMQKVLILE